MRYRFLIILLFVLISSSVLGQGWLTEENNFETNWNTTFQIGPTLLVSEIRKDFSGASNDMNNLPDVCFNLQLAKMVWERVDLGIESGLSYYNGNSDNPSGLNFLMRSALFNNSQNSFMPYPVFYNSSVTNFSLFFKYNFINFSSFSKGFIEMNVYSKIGVGLVFINSELGYRDKANYKFTGLSDPLYVHEWLKHDFYSKIVISPAFGLNYQLSDRYFLSFELSFQFMNADYVDGIRKYNSGLNPDVSLDIMDQYVVPVYDVSGKFMFGISYFFNFDTHRQTRHLTLPFYYNRYRSYYSKFQKKPTKYTIHGRLPFYNDNFGEKFE